MLGIKGSGMSALALVLKDLGHEITGSDYDKKIFTQEELEKRKINFGEFNGKNIEDIDLLVVGHNFINSDNIELVKAKELGKKILEYNECIDWIIKDFYSIAIAGSNGKTTTTAFISTILDNYENTSYLIGSGEGKANIKSKYFTFEACEYQRHFLKYHPNVILINNIDYDHIDYFKTKEDYHLAFYEFVKNAKDIIVVNGDDKAIKDLKGAIYFGIKNKKMFNARNVKYNDGISYDLYYKDNFIKQMKFNLYGEHMVYDTLAAISVTMSLGIDINTIEKAIKNFKGVKRRFKETIVNDDVYIDDYAHHPSKIRAMIEAIKSKYPTKKIVAFYRPDRVSRLDYFSSLFAKELTKANKAYILPYLNNGNEEKESIEKFLKENPKIKLVNEDIYKSFSKESNVVYLMMSSKDISEVKEKILKYKGD